MTNFMTSSATVSSLAANLIGCFVGWLNYLSLRLWLYNQFKGDNVCPCVVCHSFPWKPNENYGYTLYHERRHNIDAVFVVSIFSKSCPFARTLVIYDFPLRDSESFLCFMLVSRSKIVLTPGVPLRQIQVAVLFILQKANYYTLTDCM